MSENVVAGSINCMCGFSSGERCPYEGAVKERVLLVNMYFASRRINTIDNERGMIQGRIWATMSDVHHHYMMPSIS